LVLALLVRAAKLIGTLAALAALVLEKLLELLDVLVAGSIVPLVVLIAIFVIVFIFVGPIILVRSAEAESLRRRELRIGNRDNQRHHDHPPRQSKIFAHGNSPINGSSRSAAWKLNRDQVDPPVKLRQSECASVAA
jgi:hypothetical protein